MEKSKAILISNSLNVTCFFSLESCCAFLGPGCFEISRYCALMGFCSHIVWTFSLLLKPGNLVLSILRSFLLFPFHSTIFFFSILGLHLPHLEVPRQGLESELQLLAYTTAQQPRIQAVCATYSTAHGNARSLTH